MSDARLKDLEEISTLKAQYARRADAVFRTPGHASAVALAELFTEDGILDLGPFGRFEGRAVIQNACENILPLATAWSTHYIVSPIIDVDHHSAQGTWYFLIYAQPNVSPKPPPAPIFGSYEDKYKKVGGDWKIAESIALLVAPAT